MLHVGYSSVKEVSKRRGAVCTLTSTNIVARPQRRRKWKSTPHSQMGDLAPLEWQHPRNRGGTGPASPPGWFRAEADALGCASCRTARHPGPPRVARKEQSCRTHLSRVSRFFDTFYKAARIQAACRGLRLDMQTSGQNRESRKKPVCL